MIWLPDYRFFYSGIFYGNTPCTLWNTIRRRRGIRSKDNLNGYIHCIKKGNVYERLKIKAKLNKKLIAKPYVFNVEFNVGISSKTDESNELNDMFLLKDTK